MCGIAGILAYRNVAPAVDRAELARMNDRMAARGPDGSGIWIAADRRIGFAHRRLARRWTARGAASMAMPAVGLQKAKVVQLHVRRLAAHRPIAHLEA